MSESQIKSETYQPKTNYWESFKKYAFITWDGLGFFGFDDTKLARLRGAPVKVTDKFKSKKWVLTGIILFSVVIFVMATELSKMNTLIL